MRPLKHTKEASWLLIFVVPVAHLGVMMLLAALWKGLALQSLLQETTGGWIHPTLIFGMLTSLAILGGVILGTGRLRLKDVGLRRSTLGVGLLVTLGIWAFVQAGLAVDTLATVGLRGLRTQIVDAWVEDPVSLMRYALASLAGVAFLEETVYRGFLLPQLYFKFGGRREQASRWPMAAAVLGSSVLFGAAHFTNGLYYDATAAEMSMHAGFSTISGIVAALIYLRTENLFVVMGLHALGNMPLPLWGWSTYLSRFYVMIAAGLLLIFGPYLRRE